MKMEDLFSRLEKVYVLAEERSDIRSMIKVSELMYKIQAAINKEIATAIKISDIPDKTLKNIIDYLEENIEE